MLSLARWTLMHNNLAPLVAVAVAETSAEAKDAGIELDMLKPIGTLSVPAETGHFMPCHVTVPIPRGSVKVFAAQISPVHVCEMMLAFMTILKVPPETPSSTVPVPVMVAEEPISMDFGSKSVTFP